MPNLLLFQFLCYSCCFRDRVCVCPFLHPSPPLTPTPQLTCSSLTCSNPKAINSSLDPQSLLGPWWTPNFFLKFILKFSYMTCLQ